jgi:16S rRNA (guanine966-N2)-methyltransferase
MRVVGGKFRGRALAAPAHEGLRPTADRVREAVFNILLHGISGFEIAGARVIDLFAGTGAFGIEALSRGAAYCLFVEEDARARALIRTNVEALGLTGVTRIFRRDATDLGSAGTMAPFSLAFLDPPYGRGLGEKALAALRDGAWLAPEAVIVAEEHARAPLRLPEGLAEIDRRLYGDTQVVFGRFAPHDQRGCGSGRGGRRERRGPAALGCSGVTLGAV